MATAFLFPFYNDVFKKTFDSFSKKSLVFNESVASLEKNKFITDGNFDNPYLLNNKNKFLNQIILIASMLETLKKDFSYDIKKNIKYLAGHSLGEFAAVGASQMIPFSNIIDMIAKAETVAKTCISQEIGESIVIFGMDIYKVYELCLVASGNEVCQVACHNNDQTIIVGGHRNAINRLQELCKKYGAKKVVKIQQEFPYHCALMKPVAETINLSLQKITINEPIVPVVFNYNSKIESRPGYVKSLLFSQICNTVLWNDIIQFLDKNKITHFVEIGPSDLLSRISKTIVPKSKFTSINSFEDMQRFVDLS